jgi:four helix bundle protein
MGIVEEEADESLYWMEMLVHAGLVKPERINALMDEAREIVCMVVASIKTARSRSKTA